MPAARRLLLFVLATLPTAAAAQEGGEPHGWTLGFGDQSPPGALHVPAAAFRLADGETLHPAVAPRDARVLLESAIVLEDAGRYRFGMRSAGTLPGHAGFQLRHPDGAILATVDATPEGAWSPWLELPRGRASMTVVGGLGEAGPARMQVLWEREQDRFPGFGPEPIPSRYVRPALPAEDAGERAGRVLLESKGCTSCHAPTDGAEHAVGVRLGPDLARAGARVQPTWLRAWILDPSAYRAHADMPDLFGESDAEMQDADAVVHFLMQLAEGERDADPDPGDARGDGERLYHTLGCVACHGARVSQAELHGDPFLDDAVPGAPLFALERLGEKWHRRELARFLLDPAAVHRDGRMPSFALSEAEAHALAFALVPREVLPAFELDAAQAARGHDVFGERGCAACHSLGELELELASLGELELASPAAQALTDLRDDRDRPRGCLDPSDETTPRYDLTDPERELLLQGLAAARGAGSAPAPLDAFERRIDALGCLRCHAMDGRGGVPEELDLYFVTLEEDTDLGDEGRLPPDLSDVGFKLATPWLVEVLTGDGRARPWVATRMPRYGAAADGLAELFARRLGVAPNDDAGEPQATDALTLAGRELMGRDALSCVACHLYKDYPPSGTVGPDVTRYGERLRYEWFAAYMRSPMRYKPGTRMPTFVGQDGRSTATGILGGDVHAQIDALWSYLSLGDAMPPPPGVHLARGLPVLVGERPRVIRTFLGDAGSRGIAVGFPVGIHFAYDAERARLVSAWRGEFLDASGAWAGRGGNVSQGLGATVWTAPEQPAIVLAGVESKDPSQPQLCLTGLGPNEVRIEHQGYRIEADGTPVFLSTIEDQWARAKVRVEESWIPRAVPQPGFLRRFSFESLPAEFQLFVFPGPNARIASLRGAEFVVGPVDFSIGAADGFVQANGYLVVSTGGAVEVEIAVTL